MEHPNYISLSSHAIRLLVEFAYQYKGSNNGDLAMTWGMAFKRGWKSRDTLNNAIRELETKGWIVCTRKGWVGGPTLFALTFHGIDACNGKLTMATPSSVPLGYWKDGVNPMLRQRAQTMKKKNSSTPVV
jgi:hypothetical protein